SDEKKNLYIILLHHAYQIKSLQIRTYRFLQTYPVSLYDNIKQKTYLISRFPHTLWCSCRTFVFSLLTKGRPSPLHIVVSAVVFCSVNGFLQGHHMLHCTQYHSGWHRDTRFITGLLMFFTGMAINIHSDYILRNLRKPGEVSYKIPRGGMFELVSGANFFGEIVEWCGYAVACWSFPAFSFALFTICSIGPRAYHHHRYYLEKFKDYPKSRKAVIPFLL
uniref:3-oxo-5alpha-steroid 4-dehydrogenase (NADP(+)) n=1 Tax=Sinocyclocheilus grahami TaxID=75366 RepID=A0A672LJ35_SINGR